jgi:hypothetical protein
MSRDTDVIRDNDNGCLCLFLSPNLLFCFALIIITIILTVNMSAFPSKERRKSGLFLLFLMKKMCFVLRLSTQEWH